MRYLHELEPFKTLTCAFLITSPVVWGEAANFIFGEIEEVDRDKKQTGLTIRMKNDEYF